MDDIAALYERYHKDIYRYLYALGQNAHRAEDVMQQTFLSALKALHTFRGEASVKTWLIAIARREYYAALRREGADLPLDEAGQIEDARDGARDGYLTAMEAIRALPEPQRQITVLRLISELPFADIAQLTGRSEAYCRVSFFRAKQKLMEVLQDE